MKKMINYLNSVNEVFVFGSLILMIIIGYPLAESKITTIPFIIFGFLAFLPFIIRMFIWVFNKKFICNNCGNKFKYRNHSTGLTGSSSETADSYACCPFCSSGDIQL